MILSFLVLLLFCVDLFVIVDLFFSSSFALVLVRVVFLLVLPPVG